MTRAIVLGGGVAGIAAAFGLRDLGIEVELWESRGWLGGRAFSLPSKSTIKRRVDNGPHVMLGCYDHMRGLLRRVGTEDGFERPRSLQLDYADLRGVRARLSLPPLVPTAIALPAAILAMRGVPLGVRLRVMRGMVASAFGAPKGASLADWIQRQGQSGGPRAWFWDPLCRAIMNAEAEFVSARLFLVVLRRAFAGRASRAAIWVPKRPWTELVGDAAVRQFEREGIELRTGRRLQGFEIGSGRVCAVRLSNSEQALAVDPGTLILSALPWHVVGSWLGDPAEQLAGSPIVSVYFDIPEHAGAPGIPPALVQGLVGGAPFHFVCRTPGGAPGEFAVLSGGDRSLDHVSVAEVERIARTQLAAHYPAVTFEGVGTARVVRENRATFVADVDAASIRPRPGRHPAASNLFVCGDWTDSGLPATLESAALSAALAVRDVARATRAGGSLRPRRLA